MFASRHYVRWKTDLIEIKKPTPFEKVELIEKGLANVFQESSLLTLWDVLPRISHEAEQPIDEASWVSLHAHLMDLAGISNRAAALVEAAITVLAAEATIAEFRPIGSFRCRSRGADRTLHCRLLQQSGTL